MAGYKYVKPELIDMEFWAKMPLKWSAVKFYDKSLVKEKQNILIIHFIFTEPLKKISSALIICPQPINLKKQNCFLLINFIGFVTLHN